MKTWTEKDNQKLKRFLTRKRKPLTPEQAAEKMGRGAPGVRKHIQRLKAKPINSGLTNAWEAIVVCLLLVCLLMPVATVRAQETPVLDPATWSGQALAGESMGVLRFGFTPPQAERVTVGPEIGYIEGLKDGPNEGVLAGFYGTYDLVQNATLDLLAAQAPVTWYIGVHGDALCREGEDVDVTAGLMTGLRVGRTQVEPNKRWCAALGIEGQYLLTRDLWRKFAEIEDDMRLLVSIQVGWK